MTDKSEKAGGDSAAITTFNKGHGLSKVKLGPKATHIHTIKKDAQRRKEIGAYLSVVRPVLGERSKSFLFVCLFLIAKGWMLSVPASKRRGFLERCR